MARKGLGKGLASLIPDYYNEDFDSNSTQSLEDLLNESEEQEEVLEKGLPHEEEMIGSSRTSLLFLHLFSEYFLLDGACLRTSAYALHPYRNNLFLVGACLSTSSCTLHPYRENFFFGWGLSAHF